MSNKIDWKDEPTHVTGRNGTFECTGVIFWTALHDGRLFLDPLGKRGNVLNGGMSVPRSAIKPMIKALQESLKTEISVSSIRNS